MNYILPTRIHFKQNPRHCKSIAEAQSIVVPLQETELGCCVICKSDNSIFQVLKGNFSVKSFFASKDRVCVWGGGGCYIIFILLVCFSVGLFLYKKKKNVNIDHNI